MIRTNCAACATPLAHTAPRCGDCHTRYCGRECQKLHWKAGHKKDCKQIELGGGAEQYYADKKCVEAITLAVEECADDTKGQTCYICTEALHWKTKEGLVRGCACRGTAGFAHVSCLAEQAKVLVAEAEENNLGVKVKNERRQWWHTCRLCEQKYYGVVRCALGWACWKTYMGRPESDSAPLFAMRQLGNGLYHAKHYEDSSAVKEAELSMMRRLGAPERDMLVVQSNLANSYQKLGRHEEALRARREIHSGTSKLFPLQHPRTLLEANNYAASLAMLGRFEEANSLLRKMKPVAPRVLGESNELTFRINWMYAVSLFENDGATLDDLREAVTTLEDTARTARRVLGGAHPVVVDIERHLRKALVLLRASASSEMRAYEPAKVQDLNRKYREAYAAARGEGLAPAAAMRRAEAAVGDPISTQQNYYTPSRRRPRTSRPPAAARRAPRRPRPWAPTP
jgi:tetratricopeptide (TPR) repeat protein